MVLLPSYLWTISIWQPEGHILQQGSAMHSETLISLFSFLVLPSNPVPFQVIFPALKLVCSLIGPVTLHHV